MEGLRSSALPTCRPPAFPARLIPAMHTRDALEALYARWHRPEYLATDPLLFVHRHADPADREVAAFLAAGFAWGNVAAINKSLDRLMRALGESPAAAAGTASRDPRAFARRLRGVHHRRIHAPDIAYLLALLGAALLAHGSLEALWHASDDAAEPTVIEAIPRFLAALRALPVEAPQSRGRGVLGEPLRRGVGLAPFGFADGGKASPFKRMNMLLRWLARPADGIDLGLWRIAPARLVMPVDVHVLRWARAGGWTEASTPTRRAALEITARLRAISPEDPCRYDFALVREGMLGSAQGNATPRPK